MSLKAQLMVRPDGQPRGARLTRRCLTTAVAAAVLVLGGCASWPSGHLPPTLSMPLRQGWYEGEVVFYVTTDVSDAQVAAAQGANFAPRLAHALSRGSSQPGQASSVDKVYAVTNFTQATVFASAPLPMGAGNRERAYSPLWRMVEVTWSPGHTPQTLTSEEQVLEAEERGAVHLNATNVVLNCPIVHRGTRGALDGVTIKH